MSNKLRHVLSQKQLDYLYFMKRDLRRKEKGVILKSPNRRPTKGVKLNHGRTQKH